MKVKINNILQEIPEGTTLFILTEKYNLPDRGVAIAVNNEIIPRNEWGEYVIHECDDIVILKAFNGG